MSRKSLVLTLQQNFLISYGLTRCLFKNGEHFCSLLFPLHIRTPGNFAKIIAHKYMLNSLINLEIDLKINLPTKASQLIQKELYPFHPHKYSKRTRIFMRHKKREISMHFESRKLHDRDAHPKYLIRKLSFYPL